MKFKALLLISIFVNLLCANNIKSYKNDFKITQVFKQPIEIIKNKKLYNLINVKYNKDKINSCNIYDNILHCDKNNTLILIKKENNIFPIKIISGNNIIQLTSKTNNTNIQKKKKVMINNIEIKKKNNHKNNKKKKIIIKKENKIIKNILKGF